MVSLDPDFEIWGFLEMGAKKKTRLSLLKRSNDLDDLGYLHFRKPPYTQLKILNEQKHQPL